MTTRYTEQYQERVKCINPRHHYNITEIAKLKLFWWISDRRSIRGAIEHDQRTHRILNVTVTGERRRKRYLIEGKSIKRFIKHYAPGIDLARSIK